MYVTQNSCLPSKIQFVCTNDSNTVMFDICGSDGDELSRADLARAVHTFKYLLVPQVRKIAEGHTMKEGSKNGGKDLQVDREYATFAVPPPHVEHSASEVCVNGRVLRMYSHVSGARLGVTLSHARLDQWIDTLFHRGESSHVAGGLFDSKATSKHEKQSDRDSKIDRSWFVQSALEHGATCSEGQSHTPKCMWCVVLTVRFHLASSPLLRAVQCAGF